MSQGRYLAMAMELLGKSLEAPAPRSRAREYITQLE